jgi:hypothetical protein
MPNGSVMAFSSSPSVIFRKPIIRTAINAAEKLAT